MMNNVYVRNNKMLKNIVLSKILFLIPLILYGLYKNGIYLYIHKYVGIMGLFKPLIILLASIIVSLVVSFIHQKLIKKKKFQIDFSLQYAIVIPSILPVNINIFYYLVVLFVALFIMEFFNHRINTACLVFIIMYFLTKNFSYLNVYESSKEFSLDFLDYMLGRGSGGMFATHVLLLIMALVGLSITNNNKTKIAVSSMVSFALLIIIYAIFKHIDVLKIIFSNNYLFAFAFLASDYLSSPYNHKAYIYYGILIGLITFGIYFIEPFLAPFISILLVSIFKDIFDKVFNHKIHS